MSLIDTTGVYRQWSPEVVSYLRELVHHETSIEVGIDRLSLWHSRLNPIMRASGLSGPAELVKCLQEGDQTLHHQVIDAMTTHETLFFRDGAAFENALRTLVPELLDDLGGSQRLTIWSAASSSGQEIYSVAMFLDRHFPGFLHDGRIQLLASDVSHGMVERVKEGRYTPLEVRRGLPQGYRDAYFTFDGERWEVVQRLRSLVETRVVNLMRPFTMMPRCQLILLRNVLIYFSDRDRSSLLARVTRDVLTPRGALVLGASEILNHKMDTFVSDRVGTGVCYRPVGPGTTT